MLHSWPEFKVQIKKKDVQHSGQTRWLPSLRTMETQRVHWLKKKSGLSKNLILMNRCNQFITEPYIRCNNLCFHKRQSSSLFDTFLLALALQNKVLPSRKGSKAQFKADYSKVIMMMESSHYLNLKLPLRVISWLSFIVSLVEMLQRSLFRF